ncbi:F0F1 ATP synthase subunit A [Candidatus Acetatifactor stercoripullorum]|uniref:F0F1 ATP synthase subunit A n=1 Tax=Candidatus Acetatifactor stercoripullorum TaxID=2838414 RepID=UPI00298DEB93|nr:F0F1 ATP synthase subunit A [Candidatus Acetatifactor stercoripullorum]
MEELAAKLLEELNCETAFSIQIPQGVPLIGGVSLDIAESVVITWVIMAVILLASFFLTRNLRVHNITKRQLAVETIVTKLDGFVTGMVGEEGKAYVPYLATVLVFIGISNVIGLFGVKPPTKDMNVTAALALMSIVLIQCAGIRRKGVKGWLKSFTEPIAIVTPINILELFIRPLSLCMRLFGNVVGAFVIMELIKLLVPVVLPVPFSFYFDIFDGLIQAYVFVFLTSLFIKEAIE